MSTLSQEVSQRSGLGVFVGVVTAVIGVVMVMYPFATAQVTTAFVAGALLLVSAAQFVFAFAADSVGNFFVKLLLAILYAVAGIGLALDPAQGATALTAVLATLLLIQACIEGIFAYEFRGVSNVSGWFAFDAIGSAVLGIMIFANWPSSALGHRDTARYQRSVQRYYADHRLGHHSSRGRRDRESDGVMNIPIEPPGRRIVCPAAL